MTLSGREARFIGALLDGSSVPGAAEVAGVSERTGWRYLERVDVRGELARRQAAALAEASARLSVVMAEAVEVLREVMCDAEVAAARGSSVRVSAARAALDSGLRLGELVSLADRVAVLEVRADERERVSDALSIGGLRRGDI